MEDAIIIENVSKRYKKYLLRSHTTLKSAIINWLLSRDESRKREYIEALRGINLRIKRGTILGIIGRNGSGKTTLLKLVAGILKPDSGKISVNGRISAIIELGAGFHPEFTGRENIFINGIILGLTKKQIREKFDEIVQFAELEEFIDAPLRTYSSGMCARLGFSIAVNVDPDVLLIDEVLAVGDAAFAKKCLERMEDFKRRQKTILLVTHNLSLAESWCNQILWLDKGIQSAYGKPEECIKLYKQSLKEAIHV
jgi:lipopolysaccharide transport system ATP-binding protein